MRAFVKTNKGTFPDQNFYLAWKGFVEMGYEVILMDDEEKADFTIDTPVFAGTRIFDKVMNKLGIEYKRIDTYPEELKCLLGREITFTTLKEAKNRFQTDEHPLFVKPVIGKQFNGNLWKSFLDLIPLASVPDDAEVIVSEPINFISEFRAYINDKEIVGVKHYAGDWQRPIQKSTIEEAIKMFKSSPVAYSLDFGLTKKNNIYQDILVEVNDGTSLGNYGLDSIHYAEMLVARWVEIVASPRVDAKIKENMEMYSKYNLEMEDLYFKKREDGRCFRDSLVKDEMVNLKVNAMKDYAKEITSNMESSSSK